MPINGVVDNFSVQETAAAVNQAAVAELKDAKREDTNKRVDDQTLTQKVIESKSQKGTATQIISNLLSKISGSGIKLDAETFLSKTQRSSKDEYDMLLQNRESTSDTVDLTSINQKINSAKKMNQNNKDGKGGQDGSIFDAQKTAGTVEEFSNAFVQLITSGGTEIKKKVELIEQRLRSEGLSEKEILGLKMNIRQTIRGQLAAQIKESLIKKFLSKEKTIDWVMNNKEAYKSIEFAFHSDKLGGWDFGGFNDNLQGTVDEQIRQINSEIKDFTSDEIKNTLVRKYLGEQVADKEIRQMIELGVKNGLDPQQLVDSWKTAMNNIGLVPPPPEAFQQSMIGSGTGKDKQKSGYEFTDEDEKDLFINQLRALFMQRAIRGDFKTHLETAFKIRKLKNGMIKLGVAFADFENIQKEGRVLARVKVLEMLKEAFYERATLYELSGPAFNLIEKKMKGLVSNLDRLGMDLTKTDFDSIRDQANFKMFDVTRNELEGAIAMYENGRSPYLEKKVKLMIKLLKRLKEESNIETDYDPEKRFFSVAQAA
ncbi:MAG: hypothetical protein FD145_724 [Candidatus Saganbacteria bacterium]|uniref:Uncharacterized protein n=1 Tax=Candidatus Saganbacteria bacterium TaxID=2575572 RepID=A0A833L174_UNCSA|nr:MAG: hypothetical protein FD145_724 [Candidatus Saganbacteria bacterium]